MMKHNSKLSEHLKAGFHTESRLSKIAINVNDIMGFLKSLGYVRDFSRKNEAHFINPNRIDPVPAGQTDFISLDLNHNNGENKAYQLDPYLSGKEPLYNKEGRLMSLDEVKEAWGVFSKDPDIKSKKNKEKEQNKRNKINVRSEYINFAAHIVDEWLNEFGLSNIKSSVQVVDDDEVTENKELITKPKLLISFPEKDILQTSDINDVNFDSSLIEDRVNDFMSRVVEYFLKNKTAGKKKDKPAILKVRKPMPPSTRVTENPKKKDSKEKCRKPISEDC